MGKRRQTVIFLSALLLLSNVHCRKIGGGSSSGRGSSSARGSSSGFGQPSGGFNQGSQPGLGGQSGWRPQGSGVGGQSGGFHPQQPVGGGFRPQPSSFRSGSGLGSAKSTSSWKTALAAGAIGAVGGIIAYEAGKAIIQSATSPFQLNGRNYYWDNHHQQRNGEFTCSMPLSELINAGASTTATPNVSNNGSTTPSPDQLLQQAQFKDGTRPKMVTWGCKAGQEVCCGTDCCAAPQSQNVGSTVASVILGVLFMILLMLCCCCIAAYFCCRTVFDKFKFGSGEREYEGNKYGDDYNQGGAYPTQQPMQMQAYPPAQYPQQTYPQYPPQPSYPPNPGYPQQHY